MKCIIKRFFLYVYNVVITCRECMWHGDCPDEEKEEIKEGISEL